MKKLFSMLVVLAMVVATLGGITAFAEPAALASVTADKDWTLENTTYDSETGILTNGTYSFNVAFDSKNAKMTISGFTGAADLTEVHIPKVKNGSKTYTSYVLAANAFVGYPTISKIVAYDALSIQTTAFDPATTALNIESNDTIALGEAAFIECTTLKTLAMTAPTSVSVGDLRTTFPVLTAIERIDFNTPLVNAGKYAFSACGIFDKVYINEVAMGERLVKEDESVRFKVTVPTTFVRNGDYCLGSSYIEHIVFAEGTTAVGQRMCQGCSNLKYIDFPDSLTSIGQYAFYSCGNVISLDSSIPDDANPKVWDLSHITSIGNEALYCRSISGEIILGVSSANKQALRTMAITKVTYVNPVTTLAQNAFYQMSNLKEIVFEQGAAPTSVNSTWRNGGKAPVVIYPDTEIDSWKAFPYPDKAATMLPFGGGIDTLTDNGDGSVTVAYAVPNYKAKTIGKAVIAVYDAEENMIGVKTVDASVGTTLTDAVISVDGTAASAKIFTVDSLGSMTPVYVNDYYNVPVAEPAE